MKPPTQKSASLNLAVRLYEHYAALGEVVSYFGLLAIYGLCRTAEHELPGEALMQRCRQILDRFPDGIEHPPYNFPSYRIGGIPRAYLLMRGQMHDPSTRKLVAHYAEEMILASRDADGLLCHPHRPRQQLVWIDVAMASTPFLLFAGLALQRQDWVDEAVKQAFLHDDLFRDPANGLLHQCKNFVAPGVFSQDHWGRGNGWGYLALTELIQHLPADSPYRPAAEQRFVAFSRTLLPYQSPRGFWRQEIPDPSAWEESSATALILYGYGAGMRCGVLSRGEFGPAFERGMSGLREHAIHEDGSTEMSCPGCLCPGDGPRRGTVAAYLEDRRPERDEPHSFGPFMLALVEEHLYQRP